jgi:hypothetical protein
MGPSDAASTVCDVLGSGETVAAKMPQDEHVPLHCSTVEVVSLRVLAADSFPLV